MNKVILIGRLTREPELNYTQNGIANVTFNLAVDRQFKNQAGERETDFIRCVAWRKLAEVMAEHLGKGRRIAVEGRIQVRNYEDQQGNKRIMTEVVAEQMEFLDYPREQQQGQGSDPFNSGGLPDDFPL